MSEQPLVAHSLAEAYLYLMATPCAGCGQGPLRGGEARPSGDVDDRATVVVDVTCDACQSASALSFRLPGGLDPDNAQDPPDINPTEEPSRILDVGQWLVLFRLLVEEAGQERNKQRARRLGLEAAQCIEEALRFYDDADNDLPPDDGFFCPASRTRFREAPDQFSRQRLIGMRGKLPSFAVMRRTLEKKRPWWRRDK